MPDNARLSTLRAALQSRNLTLFHETEAMIERVSPLLWHTIATFPSGTSHTPKHTAAVEQIASALVTPELLRQLKDDEIQLLVLACHFHDLGMAGTEANNCDQASRDQARRDHAIRIEELIRDKWQSLGFRDKTLAELLAEVCRGHRPHKSDGKADWTEIREYELLGPDRPVRLRLLSALIYAADELHIDADRAPSREEEWLGIENEESRRHWRRHQAITGPTLLKGTLCFDIRVSTTVFEGDLRKHVLRKAFSAVRDANAQLSLDGIEGSLPRIRVQWLREEMWKLLLFESQSDHEARTESEIVEAVKRRFLDVSTEFDRLDGLCLDEPIGEEQLAQSVSRVVQDFKCRKWLVPSGIANLLVLHTDGASSHEFFRTARAADDLDALFAGQYASHHEFDLLRSNYGRAFAVDFLTPVVKRGYGVDLSTEQQESPVLSAIRCSPTVVRLLSDMAPAPSVLVKRHLLRMAVLAGASLDLLRSPELMLTKEFRHAVRQISQMVADGQPHFLRFIEELVLVGGYSVEQLHEAIMHSDAAKKDWKVDRAVESEDRPSPSFEISQRVPPNVPTTTVAFPYLYLAGLRSGTTIELLNTKDAPFRIKVNTTGQAPPDKDFWKISIGPAKPSWVERVDMRAAIAVDKDTNVLELRVRALNEEGHRRLPIVIGLPVAAAKKGTRGNSHLQIYLPALTAQAAHAVMRMCRGNDDPEIEFRVIREKDGHLLGVQHVRKAIAHEMFAMPFGEALVERLCSIGPETPLPWWLPKEQQDLLADGASENVAQIYKEWAARDVREKPQITSIMLRYAANDGRDYREDWLGFFPHIGFGPPTISGNAQVSQEEIDRRWEESPEDITLGASFQNDFYDLAKTIREWAEDPTSPFPLNITSEAPPSPVFKTQVELVVCPRIDRIWYTERPVILRVRPIRPMEQWEVEATYWESVGDVGRAEILRERLQDAAKASSGTDEQPGTISGPEI